MIKQKLIDLIRINLKKEVFLIKVAFHNNFKLFLLAFCCIIGSILGQKNSFLNFKFSNAIQKVVDSTNLRQF